MTRTYAFIVEKLKPSKERRSSTTYHRTEILCVVSGALERTLSDLQTEYIIVSSYIAGDMPNLYR